MKRRDKYIDMDTGLYNAGYLDCICAYWDKKGITDSNAIVVSSSGNGEKLSKIFQDIRIRDCFIIRMDKDSFVILTGKLRSSAVKMIEMTVVEDIQQIDTSLVPDIRSMEREKGQAAVEFAAGIREEVNLRIIAKGG